MQEGRTSDALDRPLLVKMKGIARNDRLVGQEGGFVLAAIVRNGLLRQHHRIIEVRAAENRGYRVAIGKLAVEKPVRADRQFVSKAEKIEVPI
jgi:hypothetical protein